MENEAIQPDLVERVARAISIPQHHTTWDILSEQERDLFYMQAECAIAAVLDNPPRHKFWGAGEPDCPREIKAGNGELHTLRCKVCGVDNPRDDICRSGLAATRPYLNTVKLVEVLEKVKRRLTSLSAAAVMEKRPLLETALDSWVDEIDAALASTAPPSPEQSHDDVGGLSQ